MINNTKYTEVLTTDIYIDNGGQVNELTNKDIEYFDTNDDSLIDIYFIGHKVSNIVNSNMLTEKIPNKFTAWKYI